MEFSTTAHGKGPCDGIAVEQYKAMKEKLDVRLNNAKPIPTTQQIHKITLLSNHIVDVKPYSVSEKYSFHTTIKKFKKRQGAIDDKEQQGTGDNRRLGIMRGRGQQGTWDNRGQQGTGDDGRQATTGNNKGQGTITDRGRSETWDNKEPRTGKCHGRPRYSQTLSRGPHWGCKFREKGHHREYECKICASTTELPE
ncbi:hypothetical protein PV326_005293 [Microctonus aethiopoides]|nr:hypothetical protein PV326_005293 [Microctonus aethiopoides]